MVVYSRRNNKRDFIIIFRKLMKLLTKLSQPLNLFKLFQHTIHNTLTYITLIWCVIRKFWIHILLIFNAFTSFKLMKLLPKCVHWIITCKKSVMDVHRILNIHFPLCVLLKLYKLQVVSNWTLGSGDGGNTTASASGEL